MQEFWACLELLHSVLHVKGGVLAEVHKADVAQLVPIMVHSSGVHRAQLQLLPLEIHLHRGAAASQPYHACLQTTPQSCVQAGFLWEMVRAAAVHWHSIVHIIALLHECMLAVNGHFCSAEV